MRVGTIFDHGDQESRKRGRAGGTGLGSQLLKRLRQEDPA